MDTEKFNMGWALAIVSGLVAGETSKMKRRLVAMDFRKISGNTYARAGVSTRTLSDWKKGGQIGDPQNTMEGLAEAVSASGTKETSVHLIFVTRAQWERSHLIHGQPAYVTRQQAASAL